MLFTVAVASVESVLEQVARQAYGRLLAYLVSNGSRWSDAEDALGEALKKALVHWPAHGIPEKPEAWLFTVARRQLVDRGRSEARHRLAETDLAMATDSMAPTLLEESSGEIPDRRLALLFVCAHPAIDPAVRTPLMLQTVLGLTAERIARAFLVPAATMGQRLSRAKAKISAAQIPFAIPSREEWDSRLGAVLEAIYAAYTTEVDDPYQAAPGGMATESIFLARTVAHLVPKDAEALGLVALLLHCEARRPARRDDQGNFVPLDAQATHRWSAPLQREAEAFLAQALATGRIGHFTIEAAIQSVHAARASSGQTDWGTLLTLYDILCRISSSLGAQVSRSAVIRKVHGPTAALASLAALDEIPSTENYQPYWVLKGELLADLNRAAEADQCRSRAIELTRDPAVRRFLQSHRPAVPPAEL